MPVRDLTGKTIGLFTVLEFRGTIQVRENGRQASLWLVRCSRCGKESERGAFQILEQYKCCRFEDCKIRVRQDVMRGNTRQQIHGDTFTRLYRIWGGIRRRCYESQNHNYPNYGGRGITVCEEWNTERTGYPAFKEWALSHGYEEHLTIDRTDPNGNYSPENCEWKTWKEQALNKRSTIWIELSTGETVNLMAALKLYKRNHTTYTERIRLGWTPQEALETPPYKRPKRLGPS